VPHDVTQIFARTILILGCILVAAGLLLLLVPRLPGDISWSRGNARVYIPLGTCLLLSLILTILFSLVSWLRR